MKRIKTLFVLVFDDGTRLISHFLQDGISIRRWWTVDDLAGSQGRLVKVLATSSDRGNHGQDLMLHSAIVLSCSLHSQRSLHHRIYLVSLIGGHPGALIRRGQWIVRWIHISAHADLIKAIILLLVPTGGSSATLGAQSDLLSCALRRS